MLWLETGSADGLRDISDAPERGAEDPADERCVGERFPEHAFRGAVRDDAAVGEQDDAISDEGGEVDVVRRDDDGGTCRGTSPELGSQPLLVLVAEPTRRLIQQDQPRLTDQSDGECGTLPLPAAEIGRVVLEQLREIEDLDDGLYVGRARTSQPLDLGEVGRDARSQEQGGWKLGDIGDSAPDVGFQAASQRPVEQAHLAALDRLQAERDTQERRLAGTVPPDDDRHLSTGECHAHVVQDLAVPQPAGHPFEHDDRLPDSSGRSVAANDQSARRRLASATLSTGGFQPSS